MVNKKFIWMIITFMFMFPILFSFSGASIVRYNFTDTTGNKAWYSDGCKDSPPLSKGPRPFCGEESALSIADYQKLNSSNDVYYHVVVTAAEYDYLLMNFTINESVRDITNVTLVWEGNNSQAVMRSGGYWWNWTGSKWTNSFDVTGQTEVFNTTQFTGNIAHVVNSTTKALFWLVQKEYAAGYIQGDYAGVVITYAAAGIAPTQILNDSYVPINEGLRFNYSIPDGDNQNSSMYIQTNETGVWKTYYTRNATASSYFDDPSNVTWFDWQNIYCDKIIGVRGIYNYTNGSVHYTPINTTYAMPYMIDFNSSALTKGNLSCVNRSYASLATTGTGKVDLTFWMPLVTENVSIPCYFGVTNVNRTYGKNQTNYCLVTANLTMSVEKPTFVIYLREAIRPIAVVNIPAAIAMGTIAAIIVIYTYVRKKKSEGW